MEVQMDKATFAAGCFWGVEEAFRILPGVVGTAVGYMGGTTENPTYEMVCTGETGHAEVVEVQFDRHQISFEQLLDKFWQKHNPTTLNRQGWDLGTQYRSVIFYHSEEQRLLAEKSKVAIDASDSYEDPIVTEIVAAMTFWRAEDYHQQYVRKNKPACRGL
jgi:peptide-methionine (S)-S-oxide reductase